MPIGDFLPVLVPVAAFGVDIAVLMVTLHLTRSSFIRATVLGFAAGLVALIAGEAARAGHLMDANPWLMALGDLAIYGCLGYCFFNATNIGESSIRVRLLREIARAEHGLSEAALLQTYNDQSILDMRLERMVKTGRIVQQEGRYVLKSAGLLAIASVFVNLKRLLLRRSSEFE